MPPPRLKATKKAKSRPVAKAGMETASFKLPATAFAWMMLPPPIEEKAVNRQKR